MSAAWRKVANCESSGNPRAVSPNGKYHGLFQFDQPDLAQRRRLR